ncbi:MAG TPA: Gfo/Idh/MocA family oxidoreductase, partial [Burkholderiaceae bacterium]|nr:Gfo/Idh/MocA family oxidoreductase [Burkholderiaceae bacterium]
SLASIMSQPVHAAGSDELKIALIGCGNRGAGAAAQALSTAGPVKLWALADAFDDRLQTCLRAVKREIVDTLGEDQAAKRIAVPRDRRFVGLDAYRKAIDVADVVLLCEPPGFRPKHFEYAVNAGKHVFMEKPVATDAVGIRRVLAAGQAAKEKGLKVSVGLQRRHQPCYHEAIERIHDGEIGDVTGMRCYWNGSAPAKSPFPRGDLSELEFQVRNWYFFTWLSGDHICEQHVHNIDVCNWIKQAYPVQAQGLGGRQVRTGKEYGNIFDHHDVEFTYVDGTKMFSQCRQIPGCWNQVAEAAQGTLGRAELNANGSQIFLNGKSVWRSPRERKNRAAYQTEHDVLFDAIRNDKPHNETEYAARSTMTAILGRMATYSGRIVSWDEAFNSPVSFTTDAEDWAAKAPVAPDSEGWYAIAKPGSTSVV